MNNHVEVERNNVTLAAFFRAIKRACDHKGMEHTVDRTEFQNPTVEYDDTYFVHDGVKYARYGKGEPTREFDGSQAPARAETCRTMPYDYQSYVLNFDGSVFNEICEFTYDDDNRGHGYYYQLNRDATN